MREVIGGGFSNKNPQSNESNIEWHWAIGFKGVETSQAIGGGDGKFGVIKIIAIKQYNLKGQGLVHKRPWEVEMTKYHGRFEIQILLLSNNVPWEVMKMLTGIVQ